ncbi:MAG: Ig-like domain-containing protein [Acidobacteria bacterium]|nr:Ig-like domain-containing protein [Acidobacteriota bacterium]
MRNLIALTFLAVLLGCAGGSDLVQAGGSVTVTVDPSTVILTPGGTQLFSARVTGAANAGVTWSVTGSGGGTFTGSTGLYTAPSTPGEFTIVATSQADATRAGVAKAVVAAPLTVTVSPKSVTLKPGATQQFSASVAGSPNKGVTWSVLGAGSGSFSGTTGLYTAPSAYGTYTVVATSQADPSRSDTATVVVGDAIRVTISPSITSVLPGGSATFTASVTGTANTSVDWSVESPANGCTIDSTGRFTASSFPGAYTVRAVSRELPTAQGFAQVQVSDIHLALEPRSVTLDQGQTQLFTPTLTGTSNLQVDWQVLGSAATVRQTGPYLFTAPAKAGRVVLQATSAASSLASDRATIDVNPVAVAVTPGPGVLVAAKGVVPFSARVTGTTTPGVKWSVLSGGAGGTINAAGVYTAPTGPGSDTVQASAAGDSSATATVVVTVGLITITPAAPPAIHPGQNMIFSALVVGTSDPGVFWSAFASNLQLDPSPISATGNFIAPAELGVYRIRATSVVNPALFAEVQITVN